MLNDFQKWKIELLGKYGGFSYAYIAATIFEKSLYKVTEKEVRLVGAWLYKNKIRVTDWRDARTSQAQMYAREVTKTQVKKKTKVVTRKKRVAA